MTGIYAMHYAVSGCPIAAKNKISGAKTKVCTYTSKYVHTPHEVCSTFSSFTTILVLILVQFLNKFMNVP